MAQMPCYSKGANADVPFYPLLMAQTPELVLLKLDDNLHCAPRGAFQGSIDRNGFTWCYSFNQGRMEPDSSSMRGSEVLRLRGWGSRKSSMASQLCY